MDSSRFSFKLFIQQPTAIDFDSLVPVLHSWIQTHAIKDHLLIDVADYSHVHQGPGIVLVSHEANYSIDDRSGQPGLTYQRKQPLEGDLNQRIKKSHEAAQAAAGLLMDRFTFDTSRIEFRICDRLNAPNNSDTLNAVKPALLAIWPGATLEHKASDIELFTVLIRPKP